MRSAYTHVTRRDFYGAFTERTLAKTGEHADGDTVVSEVRKMTNMLIE